MNVRSSHGNSSWCVQLIVVVVTFLFGFGGRTQYMYAIMLTLISANALVLCQATKLTCVFCEEHGSAHYYAARVLSISLGCLAPMLVANLILPWCAAASDPLHVCACARICWHALARGACGSHP